MGARRGRFHNASRREDGRSIVPQAHKAVGEASPPLRPHGASQVMFFSTRGCRDRSVSLSPALLSSSLPSSQRLSRREDKSAQPGSVQLLL